MGIRRLLAVPLSGLLVLGAASAVLDAQGVDPAEAQIDPPEAQQAQVDPPRGPSDTDAPFGVGPDERGRAADAPGRQPDEPAPADKPPGKPRNDVIEDVPVNPDDAAIPLGLLPYHDIPPALRALQQSDRISVEIIGQSTLGRDLHLVVATEPMTDGEWDEWQRLSDLRLEDPHAATRLLESGGYDDWRTPLLVNNNIHGNEWEGTDASLQVLEELAFSDDPAITGLLDRHVLAFIVTNNPDGRVAGTRGNNNGFDMNRDYITASQPEVRAVRQQIVRYSPLTMLDIHGYVWSNTTGNGLIEPTTGPHGDNYEYDLYIPQALRQGLAMEDRVLSQVGDDLAAFAEARDRFTWLGHVDIPYRNRLQGWDDWPPIFAPMYGMYHGAIGHTVEIPINPRGLDDPAERQLRTSLNRRFAVAAIEANHDYATENQTGLLADQLEWFRRGVDGESSRPIDDELALSLAAGDNAKTHLQDYPRAYVIPLGRGQRSDTAAARLVQFMLDNDVEVLRARRPFTLNSQNYGAGSYVVDMQQAKRGLANTILDVGRDVTNDFERMFDISAWSHGNLWGATVDRVVDASLERQPLRPVSAARPTGSVAPGRPTQFGLTVDSLAGIQAVHALLDQGLELARTPGGTFVVPGDLAVVREVADTYGVDFTRLAPSRASDAQPFAKVRLGASANAGEVFALARMGFEPVPVTDDGFNSGALSFDDFDALYVSTTAFDPNDLDEAQQAAFADWLAAGGTVVGRGFGGVLFNDRADLLDVDDDQGPRSANGIVSVVNDPESPITGTALPTTFVSSPRFFTRLGDGVRADQLLPEEDFFLAGHWIGQEDAAGQAVVVSGAARGANVTLFGTEPLFRAHPEGLYPQVANALWQAAP